MNIAVFASHGGSDLQAIIDGCKSGKINAKVCVAISNNNDSRALERAKAENIAQYYLSLQVINSQEQLDQKILEILDMHHTDMIILAGYLKKLGADILQKYENRVFNIHPALLPKYGGKGMYGINVHRAVIEAGEKISGVTVHRVTEEYDSGEIVAQTQIAIHPKDTPETLAARILECEHTFLVDVINEIEKGTIKLGK